LNSTVSGNRADDSGGGIYFALFPGLDSSLQLRLTTVADNTVGRSGGSLLVAGFSATPTPAGVVLDHAIVANGSPHDLASEGPAPMTFTANHSLIEAPGAVLLAGTGNLTGADPLLGPLGNHGGPTQTRLLLPGSPAIDAGDPAIPSPPATDQRGAARIVGPAIDLGAIEGQPGLIEVPALSPAGLALLCALLGAAGAWWLRSVRRSHQP
ncbi:MAG: choice-of-anchor Q domain-containing protein, partial [Acidobacteriota bacterium]